MLSHKVDLEGLHEDDAVHYPAYAGRYCTEPVPRYELPATGLPADAAYQMVRDELNLDGNPAMNLASFVTTWMEPEAERLIREALNKNFVDQDEYPQTEVVHRRVINMLAHLFHAPADAEEGHAVGTATVGSSEAIMLALLAHKWSWRKRRAREGRPTDRPNLVMGADVHTVWEKFTRYFDVEERVVPMRSDRYVLTADDVEPRVDENTIAVGGVLGTTFTGQMDDLQGINDLLVELNAANGWEVPLHVDGASGGFIAPFVQPDLEWDFRLPAVRSINVSNHKYGLVYPGMGTVIFRTPADLPEELVFKINYLGGEMPTYSLNFSRGSAMVLAQYYNFLRLGKEGYGLIMRNAVANGRWLADALEATGDFEILNDRDLFPVVVVRLSSDRGFSVFDLSGELRKRGWIVPAYTLPPDAEDVPVLRIVVKENFTRDMAELLVADVRTAMEHLEKVSPPPAAAPAIPTSRHRVC